MGAECRITNRSKEDNINKDSEWRNRERDLCIIAEEEGYSRRLTAKLYG